MLFVCGQILSATLEPLYSRELLCSLKDPAQTVVYFNIKVQQSILLSLEEFDFVSSFYGNDFDMSFMCVQQELLEDISNTN